MFRERYLPRYTAWLANYSGTPPVLVCGVGAWGYALEALFPERSALIQLQVD